MKDDLLRQSSAAEKEMTFKKAAWEDESTVMVSQISALQEQLAMADKERVRASEESAGLLQLKLGAATAALEELQESHRLQLNAESLRHASELAGLEDRLRRGGIELEEAIRARDMRVEELSLRVASLAAEKDEAMEAAAQEQTLVVTTLQEKLRASEAQCAASVASVSSTVKVFVSFTCDLAGHNDLNV